MKHPLRRFAAIVALGGLVLALAVPALAVNDKATKDVTSPDAPIFFQKVILDGTLRADSTGAQGAGTRDSSLAYPVQNYKQLWMAFTIKNRNRSTGAYRYAVTIRNIACFDSAGAGLYLSSYAGGDTTQGLMGRGGAYALGRTTTAADSFCVQTWMPGMGMIPHASGASALSDTFMVGAIDTTRSLIGPNARLLPGEFLVEFPATAAGGQNGTASNQNENNFTYYFPLADARGVFFRGSYVQVFVRPLLTPIPGAASTSWNAAAATVRVMLSGYRD